MVQNAKPKSKPNKAKAAPAEEKAEPVKEKKQEEQKTETEEENVSLPLPDFSELLGSVLPVVKGLMQKPEPETKPQLDDVCEVHIVGSEAMILKLFGKA